MKIDACIRIGHVVKSHGLKGEVRVDLEVTRPAKYKKLESVYIDVDGKLVPFFIESFRIDGSSSIIKFESLNSINDADIIQSRPVYVDPSMVLKEDLSPKDEDADLETLLSFSVNDSQAGSLGKVEAIDESPGQDRLVVKGQYGEILIPFCEPIIAKIDIDTKEILVDLPAGFLDLYKDEN